MGDIVKYLIMKYDLAVSLWNTHRDRKFYRFSGLVNISLIKSMNDLPALGWLGDWRMKNIVVNSTNYQIHYSNVELDLK